LFRTTALVTFAVLEFLCGIAVRQYRQDADEKEQGCSALKTVRHQLSVAQIVLSRCFYCASSIFLKDLYLSCLLSILPSKFGRSMRFVR
jgi:hypothetical protein